MHLPVLFHLATVVFHLATVVFHLASVVFHLATVVFHLVSIPSSLFRAISIELRLLRATNYSKIEILTDIIA